MLELPQYTKDPAPPQPVPGAGSTTPAAAASETPGGDAPGPPPPPTPQQQQEVPAPQVQAPSPLHVRSPGDDATVPSEDDEPIVRRSCIRLLGPVIVLALLPGVIVGTILIFMRPTQSYGMSTEPARALTERTVPLIYMEPTLYPTNMGQPGAESASLQSESKRVNRSSIAMMLVYLGFSSWLRH